MPSPDQLQYVREHASFTREDCRERFRRIWDDDAAFERCWDAVRAEQAQQGRYRQQRERTWLIVCLVALAVILAVFFARRILAAEVDRNLVRLGMVALLAVGWFALRLRRARGRETRLHDRSNDRRHP